MLNLTCSPLHVGNIPFNVQCVRLQVLVQERVPCATTIYPVLHEYVGCSSYRNGRGAICP